MTAGFGHEGDRLSAFLDDELGDRDAMVVTRHLARCDGCTDELEQLRSLRAALRGLPGVQTPLSSAEAVPGELSMPTQRTLGEASVIICMTRVVKCVMLARR